MGPSFIVIWHMIRIKSHAVILHIDKNAAVCTIAANLDGTSAILLADAVLDRIFHKRLDGQARKEKILYQNIILHVQLSHALKGVRSHALHADGDVDGR